MEAEAEADGDEEMKAEVKDGKDAKQDDHALEDEIDDEGLLE